MNLPPEQQILSVSLRDQNSFANFFSGRNLEIVQCLQQWIEAPSQWFIFISGQKGSGRTHLLQSVCLEMEKNQQQVIYLPMAELFNLAPEVLLSLEKVGAVCIDDVDKIAGKLNWEEALFHLHNRLQATGGKLLLTANNKPSRIQFSLADLQSRLNAALVYGLQSSDDVEKKQILKLRALNRGFDLSEEVQNYIIGRANRQTSALIEVLDKLDKCSLESKRKVTIPFVRSVMDW